jgi:hypothetical protein
MEFEKNKWASKTLRMVNSKFTRGLRAMESTTEPGRQAALEFFKNCNKSDSASNTTERTGERNFWVSEY